uniref:Regulatory protein zeste n=1 Tax=Heliothis virescens TaxID=7102 RepID=A0A2A4J9E5_HELVI
MTEDLFYRRQVSRQHLEVLAQYMERYPPLALASARSREGHLQSKRMWEKIARTLNRIDESVTKSGKSWARYWIDLKFKIRRKYAVIQKCLSEGTHCTIHLNPLEERIVKVLSDEEGNLLPTASVYHQMKAYHPLHYPLKGSTNNHLNIKQITDSNTKIDDPGGLESAEESQEDFLTNSPVTEHIVLPQPDIKPNIASMKHDTDPILIPEEKKSVEDLKRELVEFELRKQKELFEMEKQFKKEKHEMEMAILRIKKQMMMKQLKKL